jgi:hypothetical protein
MYTAFVGERTPSQDGMRCALVPFSEAAFEAGLADSLEPLRRIQPTIAQFSRVCCYDPGGANLPQCAGLLTARASAGRHENWIEAVQYLNMDPLREQKKEALRKLGDAA